MCAEFPHARGGSSLDRRLPPFTRRLGSGACSLKRLAIIATSTALDPHATRRRSLLLGGALAVLPGWVRAQAAAPSETEARAAMVELLRALIVDAERPLTGISVAWMRGESRVSRAWAGWRTLGLEHPQGSLPLDANTLFRVASLSKVALAVAAMRLHDARVLDLDEDLSPRLRMTLRHPQFPGVAITPRLLLSHRSGLVDKAPLPFPDGDALRRALSTPTSWGAEAPGRVFRYCNIGATVLATAMEAAARMPFEALMQRWLFDPIAFSGRYLTSSLRPEQRDNLSTLYRRSHGSKSWSPQFDQVATSAAPALPAAGENASVYAPHGGLRATVPDLSRLTRLLMQQGRWEGRKLLSAEGMEELLKPHWQLGGEVPGETAGGLFRGWGLGLQVFRDQVDGRAGDRLHPAGGWTAHGHVANAYGLHAGLMFSPHEGAHAPWGLVYVINGTSQAAAESPGQHSSFNRSEERLLERLLDTIASTREN